METSYLVSFDLFQQLVLWLNISTNSHRKGRRYLEKTPLLLHVGIDKELERLHMAHLNDQVEIRQALYQHLLLLRRVQQLGGSSSAIHEAYIYVFGGFTLDGPSWLEGVLQHRHFLRHLKRPERTNKAYSKYLQQVIARAISDSRVAPEMLAELENELGNTLVQSSHYITQQERAQAFQMAIRCHEAALHIFTLQRYPLQYAQTCMYLGLAHQRYATTGNTIFNNKLLSLEHAIAYYEIATHIFAYHHYQEQWVQAQTALGAAQAQRSPEMGKETLTQALACHTAALEVSSREATPTTWASLQTNLGDTHLRFSKHGAEEHCLHALNCYKAALEVYTSYTHPKEWADLHVRLAAAFQDMAEEQPRKRANYIGCAIVCCETALRYYSVNTAPVEYAATLATLGNLHSMSHGESRMANLALAEHYYHSSLQIFTRQAFPEEYRYIETMLRETENQRRALLDPLDPQDDHRGRPYNGQTSLHSATVPL
jgi:hypothetical protein